MTSTLINLEPLKQAVKKHRNAGLLPIRLSLFCLYAIWRVAIFAYRIFFDGEYRSVWYLKVFYSDSVHQTTPFTMMNRYPAIFSKCRNYLNDGRKLNILSFGCSTGEEVLTLRHYFPSARIVGAEINKRSLSICKRLPVDTNINFVYSTIEELQRYGPFDAMFCMAVFQREPLRIRDNDIRNIKMTYPFEKFERQLIELDKLLSPDGLLVIRFSQYSFQDTSVYSRYEPLEIYRKNDGAFPLFDVESRFIENPEFQHCIFKKRRS